MSSQQQGYHMAGRLKKIIQGKLMGIAAMHPQ